MDRLEARMLSSEAANMFSAFSAAFKVKFAITIAIASHELEPQGAAVDEAGAPLMMTPLLSHAWPDLGLPATQLLLGHHCLQAPQRM